MRETVSKVRRKKTRTRERMAEKRGDVKRPFKDSTVLAFSYRFVLWLVAIAAILFPLPRTFEGVWLLRHVGIALALAVGLMVLRLVISIVEPHAFDRNSRVFFVCLVLILSIVASRAAYYLHLPLEMMSRDTVVFLLPYAMAPAFIALLLSPKVAIAAGVWLSFVLALMAERSLLVLGCGILATTLIAALEETIRSRSKLMRVCMMTGLAQSVCVLIGVLVGPERIPGSEEILLRCGGAVVSGLACAIIVAVLLPIMETLFGLTSNITLMAFADLGNPLLQRLALEAPGTYHHSLVVANLAQAATQAIGGNPLLARVCSYYHDIGKLTKPEFFIENVPLSNNPHDDLPPSMSTLIITSHVKEGLSMGILHKLPPPLLSAIREHHGTSVIACFHHKAKEQQMKAEGRGRNGDTRQVDDSHFRYDGPIPSFRESGVICLADSIEAASRSLEKATPTHIEALVKAICGKKIETGQLDNSSLTLAELAAVRRSFTFTLTNMLHARVAYPKDETRPKQPPEETPDEPESTP